jgi:hypothetical protein
MTSHRAPGSIRDVRANGGLHGVQVLPFLETCKRGSWKCQVDTIRVETDCLGNVPCNARTAIGDNELDPGVKRSKVFQLYVCHPLSSPVESKSKRQRTS